MAQYVGSKCFVETLSLVDPLKIQDYDQNFIQSSPRNGRIFRCNQSTSSYSFVRVCFLEMDQDFDKFTSLLSLLHFSKEFHCFHSPQTSQCTVSAGIFDALNNQYKLHLLNYFFNEIRCTFFPSLVHELGAIH